MKQHGRVPTARYFHSYTPCLREETPSLSIAANLSVCDNKNLLLMGIGEVIVICLTIKGCLVISKSFKFKHHVVAETLSTAYRYAVCGCWSALIGRHPQIPRISVRPKGRLKTTATITLKCFSRMATNCLPAVPTRSAQSVAGETYVKSFYYCIKYSS